MSYNKKIFFVIVFGIYRLKVNTSLKNKIVFENIYLPSKSITLYSEGLKDHTDTISLRSDEQQPFYLSFKYMSNYHLKLSLVLSNLLFYINF